MTVSPHEANPSARPADTSAEAWEIANERLRRLDPGERLLLADRLSSDVEALATAGILALEPDASPERLRYLLAVRRYGRAFADTYVGAG